MLGIFHIISLYLELIIRPPQKCKDPLNFSYFQKGDTSCYGQLTKCKRALTSLLISPQKLHNDANIPINLVQKQKNLNIPAQSENWTQKRQFFSKLKSTFFSQCNWGVICTMVRIICQKMFFDFNQLGDIPKDVIFTAPIQQLPITLGRT